MPELLTPRLGIDPHGALGFAGSDPLDESNCYLRVLEAGLRARGVEGEALACGLLHHLDLRLVRDAPGLTSRERLGWFLFTRYAYGPHFAFPAVSCGFTRTDATRTPVETLIDRLLVLDCYHLPWHPLAGREHRIMHCAYVRAIADGQAELLDTDAAETGFVRTVPVADLVPAIVKIGQMQYTEGWTGQFRQTMLRLAAESRDYLSRDLPRLEAALDELETDFPDDLYPAVYMTMLIFLVPQLRYWATALRWERLGHPEPLDRRAREVKIELARMDEDNRSHHQHGTPPRYREMAIETLRSHCRFCIEVVPEVLP